MALTQLLTRRSPFRVQSTVIFPVVHVLFHGTVYLETEPDADGIIADQSNSSASSLNASTAPSSLTILDASGKATEVL